MNLEGQTMSGSTQEPLKSEGILYGRSLRLYDVKPDQLKKFYDEFSNRVVQRVSTYQFILPELLEISGSLVERSSQLEDVIIDNAMAKARVGKPSLWFIKSMDEISGQAEITQHWANNDKIRELLREESLMVAQPIFVNPSVEANTLSHDLSVNGINWLHAKRPNLTGGSNILAFKERLFDTLDVDLYARYINAELADDQVDSHATSMASIAAGAGNTSKLSKGVAFGANLSSSSFLLLLPDPSSVLTQQGVTIQNHSYGIDVTSEYDLLAEAYDIQVNESRNLLHVFSAGNAGLITPETGTYRGLGAFSNLTGGFKMAKNVLVVGAIDEQLELGLRSSKGPTNDGRVKPELVAYGEGGTSEAAALVSGTSLLLSQSYEQEYGQKPESAALKAILVAGADSIGASVVSYSNGFGNLNAKKSLEIIEAGQIIESQLTDQQVFTQNIQVPAGAKLARVALVWNDPAANAGDFKALINDLDLKVISGSAEILPWVLDPRPSIDLLNQQPERRIDTLNNIELITLPVVEGSNISLEVKATELLTQQQRFFLAYLFEYGNTFEWRFPTQLDAQISGTENWLSFENGFETTGTLQWQLNEGTWQTIGNIDHMNRMSIQWPDVEGVLRLKAVFGSNEYLSDAFLVTKELEAQKGYLCDGEFLMTWNRVDIPGVQFQLSKLGANGYLEPLQTTSDTLAIFNADQTDFLFDKISLKAQVGGVQSQPAQIYDFEGDGIGCFFRTFTATVDAETVRLNLSLVGNYNIASVAFEKLEQTSFRSFDNFDNPAEQLLFSEDDNIRSGYYSYRAKISLKEAVNGLLETYSDTLELPVVLDDEISIFPNPVRNGEDLNLLNDNLRGAFLQLIDLQGALLQEVFLNEEADSFEIEGLTAGMYVYRIYSTDRKLLKTGRLIVQ
ncbi:MAG TPA: S8 family serine peptidase [Roseivirga sp.]